MEIGEISPSMRVNTKPAKRFEIAGHWVLVDPNMPDSMFEKLKMAIVIHDVSTNTKQVKINN